MAVFGSKKTDKIFESHSNTDGWSQTIILKILVVTLGKHIWNSVVVDLERIFALWTLSKYRDKDNETYQWKSEN